MYHLPADAALHGTPYTKATWALTKRWWWRFRREPTSLLVAVVQPALWLLLFGNLFATAQVVTEHRYIAFMTAGVVVMTVVNGALAGGIELLFDRETGMLKRLLATPISLIALLSSRFLFVLILTSCQAVIILVVAVLSGVQIAAGILGSVLIIGIGLLLGVGITAVSMTLAFGLSSHTQFFALLEFISLPLIFASSALVPLDAMPTWLRILALGNPLTHAINAVRALVLDGFDLGLLLSMGAILVTFDVVMIGVCVWTMHRATTR